MNVRDCTLKTNDHSSKRQVVQHILFFISAMATNLLLGELGLLLNLPLYFDTLGTTILSIFFGPWMGALCGASTSLIWEIWRPGMVYWMPVGAIVGLCVGWCGRMGLFRYWATSLMAGCIMAGAATVVSVPIRFLADGALLSGEGVISQLLIRSGKDIWEAVLSASYLVEITDKVSICLLARLVALGLIHEKSPLNSRQHAARLHAPKDEHAPGLAVAGGFLASGGLYLWFFMTEIISSTPLLHDQSAFTSFRALTQSGFGDVVLLAADWAPAITITGGIMLLVGLLFQR